MKKELESVHKTLNPEPVTRDVWLNIVAIIKLKPVVYLISSLENRSGGYSCFFSLKV